MSYDSDITDEINSNLRIEKVKSWTTFGQGDYRLFLRLNKTIALLKKYQPDLIEIGSPYLAPWLFKIACRCARINPKFVGFWHADFPITYAKRYSARYGQRISNFCEKIAWSYARLTYKTMEKTFISSRVIEKRMNSHQLKNTYFLPLGVDHSRFHPVSNIKKSQLKSELLSPLAIRGSKKNLNLTELKKRKIIFFPHRLSNEKGASLLLKSYKTLAHQTDQPPLLIFTGVGPRLSEVIDSTQKYNSVFYIGYTKDADEMAKWYKISDVTVALSAWETFGLSILEAMSSGNPVIGINQGAVQEHIHNSGGGVIISKENPITLARIIQKTLESKTLKIYSKNAKKYAQTLTWDSCFGDQINEYHRIVNST